MKKSSVPRLYMGLAHYPVVNRNAEIITSAVTNLDLHDLSRVAKTYTIEMFYVITPIHEQKELIEKIVSHWTNGAGSTYNPARRKALELISIKASIIDVKDDIQNKCKISPKVVATCARDNYSNLSINSFRNMLKTGMPYLLIFGTAWGLSEEFLSEADYVLEPVRGYLDYNHLSVRSASAIIIDRLMGRNRT